MIITREQAHNLADDKTYGDWEGNALGVDEVIDTIYDAFESQTCGNCSVMECPILGSLLNQSDTIFDFKLVDFGCNQFKSF